MNVGDVCSRQVPTICATEPLAGALSRLRSQDVKALVVIASPARHPTAIGMITDRDIAQVVLERYGDVHELAVMDVLRASPLVLHESDSITEGIHRLRMGARSHAPVIGAGGTLTGFISLDELLAQSIL